MFIIGANKSKRVTESDRRGREDADDDRRAGREGTKVVGSGVGV
jgi:hypothetical protein